MMFRNAPQYHCVFRAGKEAGVGFRHAALLMGDQSTKNPLVVQDLLLKDFVDCKVSWQWSWGG